jgi:cell division septum initiation protein DivIVA
MTTDIEESDFSVKYDRYGRVDVDYYVNQARERRNEYLIQLFRALKQDIKSLVGSIANRLFCTNCQTSH